MQDQSPLTSRSVSRTLRDQFNLSNQRGPQPSSNTSEQPSKALNMNDVRPKINRQPAPQPKAIEPVKSSRCFGWLNKSSLDISLQPPQTKQQPIAKPKLRPNLATTFNLFPNEFEASRTARNNTIYLYDQTRESSRDSVSKSQKKIIKCQNQQSTEETQNNFIVGAIQGHLESKLTWGKQYAAIKLTPKPNKQPVKTTESPERQNQQKKHYQVPPPAQRVGSAPKKPIDFTQPYYSQKQPTLLNRSECNLTYNRSSGPTVYPKSRVAVLRKKFIY